MLNREAVVVNREVEADWCDSIFMQQAVYISAFQYQALHCMNFCQKKIEARVRYLVVMCVFFEKKNL